MTMTAPHRSAMFVPVPCRCGRLLRAKFDLIGSEIQCWNCHQMVVVPCPRQPGQTGRAFVEGLGHLARRATLTHLFASVALVVLALMIPRVGLVAGGLTLAAVGVWLLGGSLDRASRGEEPAEPVARRKAILVAAGQVVLSSMMAAGTVLALWGMGGSARRPPHWTSSALALFAAVWVVFPIASMMLFGRDRRGRLGVRNGLKVAFRHPFMTFLALSVVPMAVVLAEVVVVGGSMYWGVFSFLSLDLLPNLKDAELLEGIPLYNGIDFRSYPTGRFFRIYWEGLSRGYTLTAALPASLSQPTANHLNSWGMYVSTGVYLAMRGVLSGLVVALLLAAATLQASWLGALAAVDHRRVS